MMGECIGYFIITAILFRLGLACLKSYVRRVDAQTKLSEANYPISVKW